MIVRVWGVINATEVEFHPIENRPNYWEGYAPRVEGLQEIDIWAETDKGAKGHITTQVKIEWNTPTTVRLVITPYIVTLVPR